MFGSNVFFEFRQEREEKTGPFDEKGHGWSDQEDHVDQEETRQKR